MRLNRLIVAALAIGTLASCSSKEVIKEVPAEPGTVKLRPGIAALVNDTRAGHYGNEATKDELLVYNYALFIFNSSGNLEANLVQSPANKDNNYSGAITYVPGVTSLTFTRDGGYAAGANVNPGLDDDGLLTLTAGSKSFFAILNAPKSLLAVQENYMNDNSLTRQALMNETITFDDLTKIVGNYDSDSYGGVVKFVNPVASDGSTENRGFMMTTIGTNGFDTQLLEEKEDDDPYEIAFSVGRAMSKVSLASELDNQVGPGTSQPNGKLNVLSYKIINNPKEMFIMPNITNGVWYSPYFRRDNVVVGDYFVSHNTSHSSDNFIPVSVDAAKSFTYCIENANNTPREGNATQALIKGVFTPFDDPVLERILDNPVDRTQVSYVENTTFYRIYIKAFENTDGVMAGEAYDGYYYMDDPTSYLDAYIAGHSASNKWPGDIKDYMRVATYEDGVCYYRLPLRNSELENAVAPYTVKRNTYYKIDIVSVSDAGYPGETEGPDYPGPETPLEAQTYIQARITIADWTPVDQPGNL